jgi:tetratricopeptide (TPR) repeat protein
MRSECSKWMAWVAWTVLGLCGAVRAEAAECRAAEVGRAVESGIADPPVAKQESATAQVALAAGLRRGMRGKQGSERDALRVQVVAAYRAVREHFPNAAAEAAEAALRAAEVLRTMNEWDAARAELVIARDRGQATPWRARAMLELAHLERRTKRFDAALSAYQALVAETQASAGQKDEAMLWSGRMYMELKRPDEAKAAWQKVADGAEDPVDRIRAFDWLALALVDANDLEGAAGTIERCREALSSVAQEETKLGEQVRNALTAMRAHDEIAQAIARRAEQGKASR